MKKQFKGKDGTSNGKNRMFYVAAIVCGIAVISTIYIVADNMGINNSKDTSQVKVTIPTPTIMPSPTPKQNSISPVSNSMDNVPKTTTKPTQESGKPKQTAAQKPAASIEKTKLAMPVDGQITVQHSNDTLVYSPTFDDWRTHNGIDIEANISDQVKATADGVVEKIYNDTMLGLVIEINHGDFKTLYANISTDELVKKGKTVKKGDIISGIGNTSIAEAMQSSHLHFEVIYKDKSVDPAKYLK